MYQSIVYFLAKKNSSANRNQNIADVAKPENCE